MRRNVIYIVLALMFFAVGYFISRIKFNPTEEYHRTRILMGTVVEIKVRNENEEKSIKAIEEAFKEIKNPAVSFIIRNIYGQNLLGVSTFYEKFNIVSLAAADSTTVRLKFKMSLFKGDYILSIGFVDQLNYDVVDVIESIQDRYALKVTGEPRNFGVFAPEGISIEVL